VADSSGTLTLLQGERLARVRSWPAGGAVTAGPFVRGGQAACVVDRRHLVWIDPDRPEPAWTYTTPGAAIVGQPQRSGDLLFVTDLAGQFVALDVATGKPAGPALQLRSRLAPAAAATPIGGRLFAPLADGTVLLLPLDRKPAPGE
jgi:outer membrane protein assembly factor BamB